MILIVKPACDYLRPYTLSIAGLISAQPWNRSHIQRDKAELAWWDSLSKQKYSNTMGARFKTSVLCDAILKFECFHCFLLTLNMLLRRKNRRINTQFEKYGCYLAIYDIFRSLWLLFEPPMGAWRRIICNRFVYTVTRSNTLQAEAPQCHDSHNTLSLVRS